MALRRPSRKKKPKPTPRMLDMGKGRFKPKKSKKTPNPHKDSGDKMKKRDTQQARDLAKARFKGLAMGGQASESVARSKIIKDQRKRQQDKLNQMLERLYGKPKGTGKPKIVPKKKPPKDPKTAMQRILDNLNRKEILVRAKDKRKK